MTATPQTNDTPSSKPKTPLWKKFLRGLLTVLLGTYIALCLALYLAQDSMIFPAAEYPSINTPSLPPRGKVLKHEFSPGQFVEAWYVPAPNASPDTPAPLVVFFHGNGEFIDYHGDSVQRFNEMGWSVLLPEYRGYNRSSGKPSQTNILQDSAHFLKETLARPEVDKKRVVYYGRSLGGGPACDLTHIHQPQALLLNCTYSSMLAMAREMYVPSFLVKHPFRNDLVVQSFPGPVFIAHGKHDPGIPFAQAQILNSLAKHPTFLPLECGHNDFPGAADTYWPKVKTFLDAVPTAP